MKQNVKSFVEFRKKLEKDPELQSEFKADPVAAVKNIQVSNPLAVDNWVYRITVLSLGVLVVVLVVGVIVLIGMGTIKTDQDVPTILTAVGSAAIGALAGLLRPPAPAND